MKRRDEQTPSLFDEPTVCKVCGGSGFVAVKRSIDDGYGEVDTCPACEERDEQLEAQAVTDDIGNSSDEFDDWDEVPHERFLSWSNKMQLHYCWRRDLDAATRADSTNDAQFYLGRATSYKQELDRG